MKQSSCVYLIKDDQWLMLYRNKKENDINFGKYIGVGGKLKENETIEECAIREVKEETGLTVNSLKQMGDVFFLYPDNEEMITIYTVSDYEGTLIDCDEGTLQFVKQDSILNLDLWEGDKIFLRKLMMNESFHLTLQYDNNGNLLNVTERAI